MTRTCKCCLVLICGVVLSCKRAPLTLSYQGMQVGITVDSLNVAIKRLSGDSLTCLSLLPDPVLCSMGNLESDPIRIYATVEAGVVSTITVGRRINSDVPIDSLSKVFAEAWGDPDSTTVVSSDFLPADPGTQSRAIGFWHTPTAYAWVGIHSMPGKFMFLDIQMQNHPFDLSREDRRRQLGP